MLTFGVINCVLFNEICKTYYLHKNYRNAASIYVDRNTPCRNHDEQWYHTLIEMETIPVKMGFLFMLEKEAVFLPFLIIVNLFEIIPKSLAMGILQSEFTIFDWCKIGFIIVSFFLSISNCFLSCKNYHFIHTFSQPPQ